MKVKEMKIFKKNNFTHILEKEINKCINQCKTKEKKKSSSEEETVKVRKTSHLEETSMSFMQNENKQKNKSSSNEEFVKIKSNENKQEIDQDDNEDSFSEKSESDLKPNIRGDSKKSVLKIENNQKSEVKNFELIKSICNTKYFRGKIKSHFKIFFRLP
jgi:hypothetical protein